MLGIMNRRAAEMPIQTIGIVVLVVLVVVAVAVFFFSGLTQQGGIISSTATETTGGLKAKLALNFACIEPVTCCKSLEEEAPGDCCCDTGLCGSDVTTQTGCK